MDSVSREKTHFFPPPLIGFVYTKLNKVQKLSPLLLQKILSGCTSPLNQYVLWENASLGHNYNNKDGPGMCILQSYIFRI